MAGQLIKLEAGLLTLPMFVSLYYNEDCFWVYPASIAVALFLGYGLSIVFKPSSRTIYAREGFATVALSWVLLSAVGALPFFLSREIPSYVDAFFETVSGFTTTGSSVLTNVEALSKSVLFWRSFTHWVGGMGVLVFIMAIIPSSPDRTMHLLRAEMPGPTVGKLVPKAKDTAKILYLIYIVMTILQIAILYLGGMPLFDSIVLSFGSAGTGGFGIKADSIASYSVFSQWVIAVFMFLFGINFNLFYLAITKKFKAMLKSEELWTYTAISVVSAAAIAINIYPIYKNAADSMRFAAFQVSSIMTTTGYATADFNSWPDFSRGILIILMFIGGCAGSTAGGLKVSRIVILEKIMKRELRRILHPRSVKAIRFEGKTVDSSTLNGVSIYFAIYMCCVGVLFLIINFEPFDLITNFTAVATCFNNVGPGFGLVGPAGNFSAFSPLAKIVLSVAMLLGRLEIYPLIIAATPSTWIKRK